MSFARVYRVGVWFGFVGSALLLAVDLCWVDFCFDSWVLLGLLGFLRVTTAVSGRVHSIRIQVYLAISRHMELNTHSECRQQIGLMFCSPRPRCSDAGFGEYTSTTAVQWSEDKINADSFFSRSLVRFRVHPWVSNKSARAHLAYHRRRLCELHAVA